MRETKSFMIFSVCLLTYKRDADILNCIHSMFEQAQDLASVIEFIVVDNNPESCRVKDIDLPPNISFRYIHTGENLGVAGGRNAAAAVSTGEFIIFFDDDVIIPQLKKILTEVKSAFDREARLGAIAMKIIDHHADTIREFEIPHPDKTIDMSSVFYTSHCIGAGHAVRRSALKIVGGLDVNLGLYGMEEIEFCYRLIGAGYSIVYLPTCEVRHLRSPAGRMQSNDVLYRNFINKCNIAKRYLPFRYVLSHLIIWGCIYLAKSGDVAGFFHGCSRVLGSNQGHKKFGKVALNYMRTVRARLIF